MMPATVWGRAAAWLAFAGWLLWRGNTGGQALARFELPGSGLTYLYFDASWSLLVVAVMLWARWPPSDRSAWLASGALALVSGGQFFASAATRYYTGAARAWDLANYVQPMWRAAHGLSMDSATYDGRPVWGDHGSFAMFAFAPWTRLLSDAASGLFLVQSLLAAAAVLAAYGCARALGLPSYAALALACVLASSRALAQAARFDFHAECALGVALLGVAWAQARGHRPAAIALTVVAVSLRDMAALTIGMLWLYWAVRDRSRSAWVLAAAALGVGAIDMALLPGWTGWHSYVALNTSAPVDLQLAAASTVLRALSTFELGWLHPISWFSGAPWIAAAALSPKLLVKGIDVQYGFLFVPVAALGAAYALAELATRRPDWLPSVTCLWVACAVCVNAPVEASLTQTMRARAAFRVLEQRLAELAPRTARVVADACAAPYVIEREHLILLCRLDEPRLKLTGVERWEEPVHRALEASTHLVVRQDCEANGPCAAEQVRRAQQLGFEVTGREGPFVVLRRPAP